MMRVVILGCGPAGLFAAHAAASLGHDIEIYSRKRKSEMFGAQYLHRPIPGLSGQSFTVDYVLRGTVAEYAEKVYGEVPPDFVSPDRLVGPQDAWDIREAYDAAWERYSSAVFDVPDIRPWQVFSQLSRNGSLYGARVISTIPAPAICRSPELHTFAVREAWAVGDAPERGVACPVTVAENTVVCDGTPDVGWYRAANIQGFRTAEWPEAKRPPIEDVARIKKVVRTNCDCWRVEGFWRTGRYGAWDKNLLTHHAYWNIIDAFTSVPRGRR